MATPDLLRVTGFIAAWAAAFSATSPALAEGTDLHAVATAGIARPMMNHALYGLGPTATVGADLALGRGDVHRAIAFVRWTGLPATGARADIGSIEAAWRWQPSWAQGAFAQLGSGMLFEVERLSLILPGHTLDESNTRFGAPLSVALGFRAGAHVELEVGYQQLVFFRQEPRTVGIPHASIGGRL